MKYRKKVGISIMVGAIVLGFALFAFAGGQRIINKSSVRTASQLLDENQLLLKINDYRQSKKLDPVGMSVELQKSAEEAATQQLNGQYVSSREDLFVRMRSNGVFDKLGEVNAQSIGEFVLNGSSVDDVINNIVRDSQLMPNIEQPCLKYIGIGQAVNKYGHVAVIDMYMPDSCTVTEKSITEQSSATASLPVPSASNTPRTNKQSQSQSKCDVELQKKQSIFYQSLLSQAIKQKADLDAAVEGNKARLADQSLSADSRKLFTDWLSADVEQQTKAQADIDNFRSALDSINQCKLFNDSIKNLDGAYGVHY